jgi:hypothetical protein
MVVNKKEYGKVNKKHVLELWGKKALELQVPSTTAD